MKMSISGNPKMVDELLGRASALHRAGRLQDAERVYAEVLAAQPNHLGALNLRGALLAQTGKYEEAAYYLDRALTINPSSEATLYNYGTVLQKLDKPAEALRCFDQALARNSADPDLWNSRGSVLNNLRRFDEALKAFGKAIALRPCFAEAFYNRGNAFYGQRRYEEAVADYEKSVAINPGNTPAWHNLGNALLALVRFEHACTAFNQMLILRPDLPHGHVGLGNALAGLMRPDEALASYKKALTIDPRFAEAWSGRGNVLLALKRHDDALAAYENALQNKPSLVEALTGCGNVFLELTRHAEALSAYEKALAIEPELAATWLGRANALIELKRYDEALAAYDKAVEITPQLAEAWLGRANLLGEFRRYDEALIAYDKALAINPDLQLAAGFRLSVKLHLCDWSDFDADCGKLVAAIVNGNAASTPYTLTTIPSSAETQLKCAQLFIASRCPPSATQLWRGERHRHERIRIGYVSADFHDHATAYLTAGLFEEHSRSRFEVIGISLGPDEDSDMRTRLRSSFDRFIEARLQNDRQTAGLIRDLEIDIAIDLKGLTQNARTKAFAHRPAPIQVNYLGYPGTMGANYFDYIVADKVVIPPDQQAAYSEKIVFLPNSYQVNDAKRPFPIGAPTRAEAKLPDRGAVFGSFNNNFKINPAIFDRWMNLLRSVDGSVLWLLEGNPYAPNNLRREAAKRDVSPERLVFAPRVSLAEHLARHRLVDLFLDTLPYNAHTTASDALWMGVPIVTCCGSTFAGRVAASLLTAAGVPELITHSLDEYEATALRMISHPRELAEIKVKLARSRSICSLFDTHAFARHIEAAYLIMWDRYQRGEPPAEITIAP